MCKYLVLKLWAHDMTPGSHRRESVNIIEMEFMRTTREYDGRCLPVVRTGIYSNKRVTKYK